MRNIWDYKWRKYGIIANQSEMFYQRKGITYGRKIFSWVFF